MKASSKSQAALMLKLSPGVIDAKWQTRDRKEIRGRILEISPTPVLVGVMTGDGGVGSEGVMYMG